MEDEMYNHVCVVSTEPELKAKMPSSVSIIINHTVSSCFYKCPYFAYMFSSFVNTIGEAEQVLAWWKLHVWSE